MPGFRLWRGLRHAPSPLSSTSAPRAPIQELEKAFVAGAMQGSYSSIFLSGSAIPRVWCLQSGASLQGSRRAAAPPPSHPAQSLGGIYGLYALQDVQESATHFPQWHWDAQEPEEAVWSRFSWPQVKTTRPYEVYDCCQYNPSSHWRLVGGFNMPMHHSAGALLLQACTVFAQRPPARNESLCSTSSQIAL